MKLGFWIIGIFTVPLALASEHFDCKGNQDNITLHIRRSLTAPIKHDSAQVVAGVSAFPGAQLVDFPISNSDISIQRGSAFIQVEAQRSTIKNFLFLKWNPHTGKGTARVIPDTNFVFESPVTCSF
jgi:hypothetical protein